VVTKPYLGDGSFAEYVTVPVAVGIAALPDGIDFTEGAALGLAGSAALSAVDAAQLRPGQSVLVVGATGGVGNQAVQLAARTGATVVATAHTDEERRLVTGLGAGDTIDYTGDVAARVLEDHPDGVDAVLHFAGDAETLLRAVRSGGLFVSTLLSSPEQLPSEDATVVPVYAVPETVLLERCAAEHVQGLTRTRIQRVYRLDDVPTALTDFAGGTLGKLVVTVA
jgi:NADPH:quinone reductase-like Zn-dependent oxidoreductase